MSSDTPPTDTPSSDPPVLSMESLSGPNVGRSTVARRYESRTPRSREAYERTRRSVAGGCSRQTGHWLPYPLTLTRGAGARVFDLDGNEYIDLINNYTSLVHGHAYPPVTEIIAARAALGTAWSANNLDQTDLAERICGRVASVDRIRFTNSGTEAANLALQIVRAATGRRELLMARFGYHGGIQDFHLGSINQPGGATRVATFNDTSSFLQQIDTHRRDLAAVFLEPMLGAGGVLAARADFLGEVAAAAHAAGALFVLDEVQTFRMSTGGLQQLLDVRPDLTMFGKFIGGGLPVGAVGGRADLMRVFDPEALKVHHSGTFNANPLSMAAGNLTVRDLTAERIAHMQGLAQRFRQGLLAAARRARLPLTVNHLGSLLNVFFMERAPETAWVRTDQELVTLFHLACLNHGVLFAPRGFFALSTVMVEATVDEALERCAAAMGDIASAA